MSFLKIIDPKKREQTVKEFLVLKKNIRANELAEKTEKIELQTDLSEFFKPITKTQKAATREITEGLRPIKEGIEQLPQRLLQQIGYSPELIPIPTTSKEEEEEKEEEEKEEEEEEEVFPNSDTTFGFYKRDGKTFIGDKLAYIGRNDIIIGSKQYEKTLGLKQLLLSKNSKKDFFTDKRLKDV